MLALIFVVKFVYATKYDHCPKTKGYNTFIEYLHENPNGNFESFQTTNGIRINLTNAQINDGASCLDGTVPVMYWRAGNGDGINKYHVYFQGGGWCEGLNETLPEYTCLQSCLDRISTNYGSSNSYSLYMNYDNTYMSTNPNVNPVAYNWNTIFVPYCDGGSFTGNNDTISIANNTKIYFRGFRNLNGVFKELIANYSWGINTTDVLISGCSAGGLTTWLHSQFIYDTYVKSFNIKNYMTMPDSGFFIESEGGSNYVRSLKWIYEYQNSSLNVNCMKAHESTNDQYKCIFAQETAPYNNIKMFPLQSRFDSWQLYCEVDNNDNSTVNEYGNNFTTIINEQYRDTYTTLHSGFIDSCDHHCQEWNDIHINNMTASQAQYKAYYSNEKVYYVQEELYPCPQCCT